MRRCRGRARRRNFSLDGFNDVDIHIRRVKSQGTIRRLEFDVGQNGDGIAPFDHTLNVAQNTEQVASFNNYLHGAALLIS